MSGRREGYQGECQRGGKREGGEGKKKRDKKKIKKVLTWGKVFGIINKPSQDGTTLKNEYSAKKEEMLEAEPD